VNVSSAAIALIIANVIYGLNFVVSKEVMPRYLSPEAIILLRVVGATILFWLFVPFLPKEKIKKKHIPLMIACALFGVAANQLLFFAGLNLSTPINAAIIMTTNPVIVLIAAYISKQETLSKTKALGVFLAALGAILLLLQGGNFEVSSLPIIFGNLLILLNAASYATFIILSKPLTQTYHPITLIRWFFTIGLFMVIPFGFKDLINTSFQEFPTRIWLDLLFIIVGVTFFTYLLNIIALKNVPSSMVAIFIYIQPVIAVIHSIWLGKDMLSVLLVFSATMIFTGVYLVSRKASSPRVDT
jgi:drug/metabolite transporter (DMT)-like permease